MAKSAIVQLSSKSPLIQSRSHAEKKLNKELADAYEERTWRSKAHVNEEGFVCIPGIAFKRSLEEIAKYLGTQIPGKGKSTYTKHFESGVTVDEVLVSIGIKQDALESERIFVNADGVRGSGKRVHRIFPVVRQWEATVPFVLFDDILTEDVFTEHLKQAGMLIGVGSFRVRNGGYCGRFAVDSVKWEDFDL